MEELQYGPILVTKGPNKGRIGIYDDEDVSNPNYLIIYPNVPTFCKNYYTVKQSAVTSVIPTERIAKRWEEIEHVLYCDCFENTLNSEETINLLHERILCSDLLNERYLHAIESIQEPMHNNVFISHSSTDSIIARSIATDLMDAGYSVFLDDWSIDVGDRIFEKINQGLENSSGLIMIISQSYLQSICCNDEWSSFYNKSLHTKNCRVYPIIIDESNPPVLLNQIKYLRFDRENYSIGLSSLLKALKKQFTEN